MAHTVLVASNNTHKLQELREIVELAGVGNAVRLIAPEDLSITLDPDETASTYLDNALIKARAFAQAIKDLRVLRSSMPGVNEDVDTGSLWVMADDSGLEVDALGGRPGIYSSRYHEAAPNGDGSAALLHEMNDVSSGQRTARFRCMIVLIGSSGDEHVFEGVCEGRIGHEKRGANGFGFDPVFLVGDGEQTMAELPSTEKHRISHRGIAGRRAAGFLLRQ